MRSGSRPQTADYGDAHEGIGSLRVSSTSLLLKGSRSRTSSPIRTARVAATSASSLVGRPLATKEPAGALAEAEVPDPIVVGDGVGSSLDAAKLGGGETLAQPSLDAQLQLEENMDVAADAAMDAATSVAMDAATELEIPAGDGYDREREVPPSGISRANPPIMSARLRTVTAEYGEDTTQVVEGASLLSEGVAA